MVTMRIIFLTTIGLLMIAASWLPSGRKWVVDSSSRLLIHGSTNVNKFVCATDCYNLKDTLEYVENTKSCEIMFSKNEMTIPVQSFNCGNDMITKDFWNTLNVKKYPDLKIQFISLNDSQSLFRGRTVTGKVQITLAGVTRTFQVKYDVRHDEKKKVLSLLGRQPVCFSDFQLKAPVKMMGLIQVQEDLDVEFHLNLIPV